MEDNDIVGPGMFNSTLFDKNRTKKTKKDTQFLDINYNEFYLFFFKTGNSVIVDF